MKKLEEMERKAVTLSLISATDGESNMKCSGYNNQITLMLYNLRALASLYDCPGQSLQEKGKIIA